MISTTYVYLIASDTSGIMMNQSITSMAELPADDFRRDMAAILSPGKKKVVI